MRKYVTDGEGPVTKNDNAYELSEQYLKGEGINGSSFFTVVSSYDDVLAYIVKRENYNAGDTLKLILPFLRAYGATNQGIMKYSINNVLLVPGATQTLRYIYDKLKMPVYMISTSYEPYVEAVRSILNIPFKVYCTKLKIDKYLIPEGEKQMLIDLSKEISSMKPITVPSGTPTLNDLSEEDQKTFEKLEEIFWATLPKMAAYKVIREVKPIGGLEKANAIHDICKSTDTLTSDLMYVGDSITDVEALRAVKKGGGLAVSFNGNAYPIGEAHMAVLSPNTIPLTVLAEAFYKHGLNGALSIVNDWSSGKMEKYGVDKHLLKELSDMRELPRIYRLTEYNRDQVADESSKYRKTVRGERRGALG